MPPLRSKKSKTSRFPVARIKKIMQLDEEVGKLASSVPCMMSKSLECFMQLMVDETSKETIARGSKKMTAYHLKHMINSNPQFDFLREIVQSIPDPVQSDKPTSSKARKTSTSADPNATPAPRKKRVKKEKNVDGDAAGDAAPAASEAAELPAIGTWKRDPIGGGGTGEDGKGMFDDYEEDDEDY